MRRLFKSLDDIQYRLTSATVKRQLTEEADRRAEKYLAAARSASADDDGALAILESPERLASSVSPDFTTGVDGDHKPRFIAIGWIRSPRLQTLQSGPADRENS